MMKKKAVAKTKQERVEKKDGSRIVGEVKIRALADVQPNTWNPNRMTPFMRESLKQGLLSDGWLSSQSLLIWGTDERGAKQNVIIDGEHRYMVAKELGFSMGPMVVLERLPLAQAKALTVKMNQKRGEFADKELGQLLRDIQFDLGDNLSVDLGIETSRLLSLMAIPAIDLPAPEPIVAQPPGDVQSGLTSHVRMVQLFFNKEQHESFIGIVKELAPRFGTENVTDTVLEAMTRARTGDSAKKPHVQH